MRARSVRDALLDGSRVFLRADLNVPLEDGRVADDTRIREVLPTIRLILDRGASLVMASHLGRPDGEAVPSMSLAPVAVRLTELLGRQVVMAPDCVGRRVEALAAGLRPGGLLLLENLRFNPGEEAGDPGFAAALAGLADVYVNDAFGTCHRAHASMTGVPSLLGGGYVGLLVEKELDFFRRATVDPARPFTLLLGGAKVSDKVPVIENLLDRVDNILIGGGMAFTFMAAAGTGVGRSLLEPDRIAVAAEIVRRAGEAGVRLVLPSDVVVSTSPDDPGGARTVPADAIPDDEVGLDVGPSTVAEFSRIVMQSGTIVWNGPMGLFEKKPFDAATTAIARALAEATSRGALTVVGGGDSARAVAEAGVEGSVSFVSTGGGVSLKLLQGKPLVALQALGES